MKTAARRIVEAIAGRDISDRAIAASPRKRGAVIAMQVRHRSLIRFRSAAVGKPEGEWRNNQKRRSRHILETMSFREQRISRERRSHGVTDT